MISIKDRYRKLGEEAGTMIQELRAELDFEKKKSQMLEDQIVELQAANKVANEVKVLMWERNTELVERARRLQAERDELSRVAKDCPLCHEEDLLDTRTNKRILEEILTAITWWKQCCYEGIPIGIGAILQRYAGDFLGMWERRGGPLDEMKYRWYPCMDELFDEAERRLNEKV